MSEVPDNERLLAYVRVVAAAVTLILFSFAVVTERDVTTVGMLFGSLAVLLGLASFDAVRMRDDR